MFEHMEKTLLHIGFLDSNHPKRIMRVLRRLFGRSQMDEREVQILHGIWSQMDCYLKNREKGQIKTLPRIILEKGFERKHRRSFLLLFQKKAEDVNRHGEDGG